MGTADEYAGINNEVWAEQLAFNKSMIVRADCSVAIAVVAWILASAALMIALFAR